MTLLHDTDSTSVGVLLANLGTPDAPTPRAVRRYLAEFLSDPRVVEMARLPWWLILHGIILRTRPRRSAKAYRKVWTEEGSPLLAFSRRQAEALQHSLAEDGVRVELAMRYGNPSIPSGLKKLHAAGVRRILVLPLYPQYSATTTASTFDAVTEELRKWRAIPELRMVHGYHDDPRYIAALAESVRDHRDEFGAPSRLLFSFHGIPLEYAQKGDPYAEQCLATAQLLAEELRLRVGEWAVSFQSRLGRQEWLKPYTSEVLAEWGRTGMESVHVLCPGFPADCLETLEEIAVENRAVFQEAGGGEFHYIGGLNDRPSHIFALTELARRHLAGWI